MKMKNLLRDHSPQILAGLGIAGFIGAIIITARNAPKAEEALEELDELVEEPTLLDKVKVVAPYYGPVVGLATMSTGMVLMNHHILTNRAAGLLAAYTFADEAMHRWQKAVQEKGGKKIFEEVQQEAVKATEEPPHEIGPDEQLIWIWDEWTAKYFTIRSVEEIYGAVNRVNALANEEDFSSLNDFYYNLGQPRVAAGDDIGWGTGGHQLKVNLIPELSEKGQQYLSLVFVVWPTAGSELY